MRYCVLFLSLAAAAWPQTDPPAPVVRRFDVISVKPSRPGAVVQDARMSFAHGRFEAVNYTVGELLSSLNGYFGRVDGGPKWAGIDRYDIVAKVEGEIAPNERSAMVLGLLQERFQLATHPESRPVRGFGLNAAKTPPQLKESAGAVRNSIRFDEKWVLQLQGVNMPAFAHYISQLLHLPVVDHTGIKGAFDFSLDPYSFARDRPADSAGPGDTFADLLRAAVEHAGFKLTPENVTLNFTVIDRIERPSEN